MMQHNAHHLIGTHKLRISVIVINREAGKGGKVAWWVKAAPASVMHVGSFLGCFLLWSSFLLIFLGKQKAVEDDPKSWASYPLETWKEAPGFNLPNLAVDLGNRSADEDLSFPSLSVTVFHINNFFLKGRRKRPACRHCELSCYDL